MAALCGVLTVYDVRSLPGRGKPFPEKPGGEIAGPSRNRRPERIVPPAGNLTLNKFVVIFTPDSSATGATYRAARSKPIPSVYGSSSP